jgi:hypothetical protein
MRRCILGLTVDTPRFKLDTSFKCVAVSSTHMGEVICAILFATKISFVSSLP